MTSFWDTPTKGRLAPTPGVSTGGSFWDTPSRGAAPEEDTSVTGRIGGRLEQLTSGKRFIQDTTGYDISKLPGYISTPLDILANPLGIASLLAAIPTGGTSLGATAGARAAGLGTRLALQTGKDLAGGIVGAEAGRIASSALPEDTPEWLKMGVGLAAGVGGGYATGKVISNAIPKGLAGVSEGKVKGAKGKVINSAQDPMVLEETVPGLTKTQQASNFVKDATGLGVKANALTTPIIDDIAPGVKQGESLANEYKIKLMAAKAGRDDIKYGKYQDKGKADLINIEGEWKPLLKVAAQPENYALTESQLDFIRPITAELDSWKAAYERQGGKVGRRADLSPGGFYLPRGVPGEDLYPGALPYNRAKQLISKPGAAQHAIWDDVEEALLAGKDYPPLEDAVHDYISGMSKAIVGRSAANKFFALRDSDGVAYFRTAAEMVDPQISGAYKAAESAKYGLDKSIEETAQAATEAKIRLSEVRKQLDTALVAEDNTPTQVEQLLNLPKIKADLLSKGIYTGTQAERSAWIGPNGHTLGHNGGLASITDHAEMAHQLGSSIQEMLAEGWIRRAGKGAYEIGDLTPKTARAIEHVAAKEAPAIIAEAKLTGKEPTIKLDKLRKDDPNLIGDLQSDVPQYDTIEVSAYADQRAKQLKDLISSTYRSGPPEVETRIEELLNLYDNHNATLTQLNETSALHQLVLDSAKGSYDEAVIGIANDPMVGVIDSGNLSTIFQGRNEKVYGPRELTDPINAQLNPNGLLSKTSDVVKSVNAPFRLIHTLFDLSDFGRLALQNVLTNPNDFFKGITVGFRSGLGNPAARARDIETINNILTAEDIKYTYRDFIKIGKLVVGNPDVDLGLLNALPDSKIIDKLKGVSNITQAGIDSIRGHMITTELLNMKRAGITIGDAEVLKAVRAVSLTTGQSIHRAVKGVDVFVQFPNWLQSQFEYIAHAGAGLLPGASYESKYAANSMIRMVGFGIASTMAVNAMGGHKTEFQNGVPMMRVGDMKINAFGPYGALVNGMLAGAKGDATSLVRARVSPLFQVGWDLSTGKTYTGETASFDDPAYWAKTVAPFSVSGGVPGQGPEITLLQGAGVRANPVSTFTKLREQAKETMGTDWADLSGQQREQLRKANPELVAELDKQTKIKAGQGDNYAKTALATQDINANLLQQQESINKLWQEGQISSMQLREGLDSLSQASSAQKQQVRKDFGTNKGSDTPARVQTALNQYFDLYTLADSGILSGGVKVNITDWDVFDRLEAELMGKLDPVQQKAIQDRYTVKSPALKWYYDNKEVIRNSGYFDATQTVVGRMQGRLKTVVPGAESYSDIQQALNKAQLEGNVAKSYQILSVINGINQQVAPIHQQMTRSNPLLYKALVQNGYVKQSMGRPLASTIQ